jgi:hypothetical protein
MDLVFMIVFGLLPLMPPLAIVAIFRWGPFPNRWWQGERVLGFAMTVAAIAFSLGFFGPMVFMPDANQGPLLGLIYTGPLGLLVGLVWGAVRALRRRTA